MRRSVFIKYALSYTLVLLLLFSGVTFYMIHTSQRQVQEDIVTGQVNRLNRIAIRHEDYISTMLSTAEEIGLSPHIEPFRFDEEPWKAYDLQLQLIPYTATNSFCDQLYLYFPEDDRLYSSSASMTLDRFSRMTQFEQTPAEDLAGLLRTADRLTVLPAQRVVSNLIDGADSRMVGFILPLGASPARSKGSVFFLIKESVYRDMFADAIDTDLNTYIRMGDQVIASAEDLPLSPAEMETAPDGEYSRVFSRNNDSWLSVSLPGRSWGMRYDTVLRMADVKAAIRSSLGQLLLFLVSLLLVSVLLILWVARHHAKPIEAISGLLAPEDDTRKDELTRISTGIRYLTRANSELSSRLDESLPMQRHDFVLRFFKGRFASPADTAAAAERIGLDIRKQYYAAILCSPSADQDRPFEMSREPFSSLADVTAAGVELVAMKAILYLAFANDPDMLNALADMIRRESGNDETACVTAISAVHSQPAEAPAAYLEAAAAYDNRFVMGHSQVLAYTDISSSLEGTLPRAQKITNSISQALALNNRELLDSRISELLHFLKNTNMSPFAFRMIYNNVIDTLTRDQAAKLAGHDARDFYDIFSLTSCQSIDDLDELLRRLCDHLLSGEAPAEDPAAEPAGDEIDQAIRYIDTHFTDPEISMTAIAESIDLSTTRLSLSFKERMGMTPSDYLTLLRCERARDLLENTDQTIREISTLVGYYDAGSFIRRFKQVTGETPLQYRRTRRPGKESTNEEE